MRGLASGRHYGSSGRWPLIPGVDAVVRSADGVLAYSGFPEPPYGTLAERISVPSFLWVPIPEGADPARIAGGLNPGMASWLPLQARRTEIGRLNNMLILGVTGMAGLLAAIVSVTGRQSLKRSQDRLPISCSIFSGANRRKACLQRLVDAVSKRIGPTSRTFKSALPQARRQQFLPRSCAAATCA